MAVREPAETSMVYEPLHGYVATCTDEIFRDLTVKMLPYPRGSVIAGQKPYSFIPERRARGRRHIELPCPRRDGDFIGD